LIHLAGIACDLIKAPPSTGVRSGMQAPMQLRLPGDAERLTFLLCSYGGMLLKCVSGVIAGAGVLLLYLIVDAVLALLGGGATVYYRVRSWKQAAAFAHGAPE
jgi:hypothetical protein